MSQAGGPQLRPRRASRVPAKAVNDENAPQQQQQPRLIGKSSAGLGGVQVLGGSKALATKSTNSTVALGTTSSSSAAVAGPSKAGPRRALGDVSNAIRGAADRSSKETVAVSKPSRSSRSTLPQHPSSTSAGFSKLSINAGRSSRPSSRAGITSDADVKDDEEVVIGLGIQGVRTHEDEVVEIVVQAPSSAKKRTAAEEFGAEEAAQEPDPKVRIVDVEDVEVDIVDQDDDDDEPDWALPDDDSKALLQSIKTEFEEQLDYWDTTMVAEYSDEIFEYMARLETKSMPNPRYMDHQTEIEWSMRTTLIDWLLQVHMRYHMLPETLWIAINVIDRFLSNRVVSLAKFQLVGVTAMFIAAKYEEIMAPSVDEFVYMTENGYSREEILKGERIILQSPASTCQRAGSRACD